MTEIRFNYDHVFFSDFTGERLAGIVRLLNGAYGVAQAKCSELDPALAKSHRFSERRVWVEQSILDNAARIAGVRAELRFTEFGWPFVVLLCGSSLMTISYVRQPGAFARPARYRKQLARNAQGRLWEVGEPAPPRDASVYGILLHTPGDIATGIGSVHVGFPHHELNEYLSTPVNIAVRFPQVYDVIRPTWHEGRPQWRSQPATGSDED